MHASQSGSVIVFCDEGYASSLAAGSLRELGLVNAIDLVGGFHAWAGLPVTGGPPRPLTLLSSWGSSSLGTFAVGVWLGSGA
ncbi:rhodanese-like domain-containing protein [Jiangella aurantiaca]|uniref:rhodanese-like domain-containing protein n=1 Tax=Jiangella aurantiaca TaxID=2530373 RepID=UPI00193E9523|nr:rhodanese-like domain-containing protein [Jiangella aurantiaca]